MSLKGVFAVERRLRRVNRIGRIWSRPKSGCIGLCCFGSFHVASAVGNEQQLREKRLTTLFDSFGQLTNHDSVVQFSQQISCSQVTCIFLRRQRLINTFFENDNHIFVFLKYQMHSCKHKTPNRVVNHLCAEKEKPEKIKFSLVVHKRLRIPTQIRKDRAAGQHKTFEGCIKRATTEKRIIVRMRQKRKKEKKKEKKRKVPTRLLEKGMGELYASKHTINENEHRN